MRVIQRIKQYIQNIHDKLRRKDERRPKMSATGSGDRGEDGSQQPNGSKEVNKSTSSLVKIFKISGVTKEVFAGLLKVKYQQFVKTRNGALETVIEEDENAEIPGPENVGNSDGERSSRSPNSSVSIETVGCSSNQGYPENCPENLTPSSKTKECDSVTNSEKLPNEIGETSPITSEEEESNYKEPAKDSQSVATTVPHHPESIENENATHKEQKQNEALDPPFAIETASTNENDEQELIIDEDEVDICVDDNDIEDRVQFPETDGVTDDENASSGIPDDLQDEEQETNTVDMPELESAEYVRATVMSPFRDGEIVEAFENDYEAGEIRLQGRSKPKNYNFSLLIIDRKEAEAASKALSLSKKSDDSDGNSSKDLEPGPPTKRRRLASRIDSLERKRKSIDDDSVGQNEVSKRQKSGSTRKIHQTAEESQEVSHSTSNSRRTTIDMNTEPNPTTIDIPEVELATQIVEKDLEMQVSSQTELSHNEVSRFEVSQSGVQQTTGSDQNQSLEEMPSTSVVTSVVSGENDSCLTVENASSILQKKSQQINAKAASASITPSDIDSSIENHSSKDLEGSDGGLEKTANPSSEFEATERDVEKTIEPTVAPLTLGTYVGTRDDRPEKTVRQAKTTEQIETVTLSDDEMDCTRTMSEEIVTIPQLKLEIEARSQLKKVQNASTDHATQGLPDTLGALPSASVSEEPLCTPNSRLIALLLNQPSDPPIPLQTTPASEELIVPLNSSQVAPEVSSSDKSIDPVSLSQNAPVSPGSHRPVDPITSSSTTCQVPVTERLDTPNLLQDTPDVRASERPFCSTSPLSTEPETPSSDRPLCSTSSVRTEPETPVYERSLFSPLHSVPSATEALASERPVDPLSYYITTNLQELEEYPVLSITGQRTTSLSFAVVPASADISTSNESVAAAVTTTSVSPTVCSAIITSATVVPTTSTVVDSPAAVESVPGNEQTIEASHATDSAANSGSECIVNPVTDSTSPITSNTQQDDGPENEEYPILRIRTDIFEETDTTPEGENSNEQAESLQASTSNEQAESVQVSTSNEQARSAQVSTPNAEKQAAYLATFDDIVQQSMPNLDRIMTQISTLREQCQSSPGNRSHNQNYQLIFNSLVVLGKTSLELGEMTGNAFLTIKHKHPELKLQPPIILPTKEADLTLDQMGDYFEMLVEIFFLYKFCGNEIRKPSLHMIYSQLLRILHYFMFSKNVSISEQRFLNVYSYLSKKSSFKERNYHDPEGVCRCFWDRIRTQGGVVEPRYALLDHNSTGVEGYKARVTRMRELHESEKLISNRESQSLTNQTVAGSSVPAGTPQVATATNVSNNVSPCVLSQPQHTMQGGLQNVSSVQLQQQYSPQLNATTTQVRSVLSEPHNLRNYQQQQPTQYQRQQQPTQYRQPQSAPYQQHYQVQQPQLGQSHQVQQSQIGQQQQVQQSRLGQQAILIQQQQYQLRMQQGQLQQTQQQTCQPRQQYVQQQLLAHGHSQPLPQQVQVQTAQQTQVQQHLQVQTPQQVQLQQHLQVQTPQQAQLPQHLQVQTPQQAQLPQHLQVQTPQQAQLPQHLQVQTPQQAQLQQHLQVQAHQRTQMQKQIQVHAQQQPQMPYQQQQRTVAQDEDDILCLGVVSPPVPSSPNVSISAEQQQPQTQETCSVPQNPANHPRPTIMIHYDGVQIGQTQYYGQTAQSNNSSDNVSSNQTEAPQTPPAAQLNSHQSDGTSGLGNLTLPQLLQRGAGRRAANYKKTTEGVTVRAQQQPNVSSRRRSRSKSNDGPALTQTYAQLHQQQQIAGGQRTSTPGVPQITSIQGNYSPNNTISQQSQMPVTPASRLGTPSQGVLRQHLQQRRVAQQPAQNTTTQHRLPLATSQATSVPQQMYNYPTLALPATATSSHQVLGASTGYAPRNQAWNGQGAYQQTSTMTNQNQATAYNTWAMNNQVQSTQGAAQASTTTSNTYNRGMAQHTTAVNQNFAQGHPPQQQQRVLTEQEMIAQANTIFYPDGNGSVRAVPPSQSAAQQPSSYATTATYTSDQNFNWQQ